MRPKRVIVCALLLAGVVDLGCGADGRAHPDGAENKPAHTQSPSIEGRSAPPTSSALTSSSASPTGKEEPPDVDEACPSDMALVDTEVCTDVERRCLDDEYTKSNKITICHQFAEEPARCVGETRRERFCIDRYEFPNQAGKKPPVMVDFHDSMALCEEAGKRLCWESEWTAACEGPDQTPFPYGYKRSPETCNIDNPWKPPELDKTYSPFEMIHGPEIVRLDQGVPSGAKPGCKSGFDVFDQTGNVDEWVMLEKPRGRGGPAGLKGGAWGHVRNACRPVTTSHAPNFTYYFVSLRCCKDAPDAPGKPIWKAPPLPPNPKDPSKRSAGFTPPVVKPKYGTPYVPQGSLTPPAKP